ncbi:hypothetical protein NDN08_004914 [Rhodosorus marinus]|uniref:RPA-interacting protein C-terminal domain-containing protein n=1 Tax=Rhodosorus marinus TaxID=101924 RepID=A0AAV8UF11_9RHOD|nr:hypothetical protein NDN08_004914 [Rhodosorus marinus]
MMCEMKRVLKRYDSPDKRWKETMFVNCMQRLKDRRRHRFDAHRRVDETDVAEVMMEEVKVLARESEESGTSNVMETVDMDELEFEILNAIEAEEFQDLEHIVNEEIQELEVEADQREEIELDLQGLELSELEQKQIFVLCPVCLKDSLRETGGGLMCSCGTLLAPSKTDGPNISAAKWELEQVYAEHASNLCAGKMVCTRLDAEAGGHMLRFTCEECPLNAIVPDSKDPNTRSKYLLTAIR